MMVAPGETCHFEKERAGCRSHSERLAIAESRFFLEAGSHVLDDIVLRTRQHVDVTGACVLGQLNRLVEGAELALKVPGEVSRDRVVIQTSPAPPGPAAPSAAQPGGRVFARDPAERGDGPQAREPASEPIPNEVADCSLSGFSELVARRLQEVNLDRLEQSRDSLARPRRDRDSRTNARNVRTFAGRSAARGL